MGFAPSTLGSSLRSADGSPFPQVGKEEKSPGGFPPELLSCAAGMRPQSAMRSERFLETLLAGSDSSEPVRVYRRLPSMLSRNWNRLMKSR